MKQLAKLNLIALCSAAMFLPPVQAQDLAPPLDEIEASPEVKQAAYCAALQTFVSAMLGSSSRSNPATEERLRQSSIRWLEYAATLVPGNEVVVMDLYLANGDEHFTMELLTEGDPAEVREFLRTEMQMCSALARETFSDDQGED